MQEIRRKYSKMSNDLHESKMKNAKLNQDKREYEKKERDWVLKLGREKEKYNLFSSQVRKEMGNAALVKVFHDMTSSTPLSKMMNGEQRNSSKAVGGGASFASSGERVNNGYVNHQGMEKGIASKVKLLVVLFQKNTFQELKKALSL